MQISNKNITNICEAVAKINRQYPLWWTVFLEDVILNKKVSYINHTTIIVSVYELSTQEVIILYEVLKILQNQRVVVKVINKREFVIIHFNDIDSMNYLTSKNKWLSLMAYTFLCKRYSKTNLTILTNTEEDLKLKIQGVVYHFYTEPSEKISSNKYHKYIYLYNELNRNCLKFLDYKFKYYQNANEFLKNFDMFIEDNS